MHWVPMVLGVAILALSAALRGRTARGAAQGLAVLLVATGVIMAFRRPGSPIHLPGWGPRQWTQP
ncbi:hypothetical protein [Falsiroseomonas ponticola]|jgi:hypothetical protein|uniref:hypothetical protein n=1 Tax=Falsiroseomonas ponticola TaxID=2786951 RepID=UPI0019348A33|nr:hypothetical protein [Roseomonas ponticola]